VERVADTVLGGSSGMRETQTLAVRLGILATFFGIVMSLQGVSGMMTGGALDDSQIRGSIQDIVTALGAAFSSSIAGLSAAILAQVLGGFVRAEEDRVIEALHRIGTRYQGICRLAQRENDLKELNRQLVEHGEDIRRTSDQVVLASGRMDDTATRLIGVLDAPVRQLEAMADRLTTAMARQDEALRGLAEAAQVLAGLGPALAARDRETAAIIAGGLGELQRRLVGEFRAGYDVAAAERMEAAAERQYRLVAGMARSFLMASIAAGLTLVVVILAATGWGAHLVALAVGS
jgi:hypothetical protein